MSEGDSPPFSAHRDCQTLTGFVLDGLPRDRPPGRARQYRKGEEVWLPGDKADRIYFLQRGRVAVIRGDVEGREIMLRVTEAGEPFGELCFCSEKGGVRHTTARTVAESEAIEVRLDDFTNYLQQDHEVLEALIFTFCMRLSDAEERVEVLSHHGAEDRLGRLLLQLAASRGKPADEHEDKVSLHVSHNELAQMVAMSRPHVTVTMGAFRRRGLVTYAREEPLVVDVPALENHLRKRSG